MYWESEGGKFLYPWRKGVCLVVHHLKCYERKENLHLEKEILKFIVPVTNFASLEQRLLRFFLRLALTTYRYFV